MVGRDDMPTYLAAADIVAVPSIHYDGYVDGLPNVALEAMAAGRALVATVLGASRSSSEMERTAFWSTRRTRTRSPRHSSGLRVTQRYVHGSASAGEEIRRRRNWDVVASRFVDVYERAIAGR